MPRRERVHTTHDHSTNTQKELSSDEAERMANADTTKQKREHKASDDTDALLDEIDRALEGLDQDLAIKFRQKGGQ